MTAFAQPASKPITNFIFFLLIFLALLFTSSCNTTDSQKTEDNTQTTDTSNQALSGEPEIAAPTLNILYATKDDMKGIVNRLGTRGKKIVFQDCYVEKRLTLAAFTGKPGHAFEGGETPTKLRVGAPAPLTGSENLIFGDLELSGQGHRDFSALQTLANGTGSIVFFFTPTKGGVTENSETHVTYKLEYNSNGCQNLTDLVAFKACYDGRLEKHQKDTVLALALEKSINPVPPRDAQ